MARAGSLERQAIYGELAQPSKSDGLISRVSPGAKPGFPTTYSACIEKIWEELHQATAALWPGQVIASILYRYV